MTDPTNHPPHYTQHPSGVECIDITRHMNFCLGNAMKYIWRAGLKGDEVTDLRKAVWYLLDEIARREGGNFEGNTCHNRPGIDPEMELRAIEHMEQNGIISKQDADHQRLQLKAKEKLQK